jgi:hypothetical protein
VRARIFEHTLEMFTVKYVDTGSRVHCAVPKYFKPNRLLIRSIQTTDMHALSQSTARDEHTNFQKFIGIMRCKFSAAVTRNALLRPPPSPSQLEPGAEEPHVIKA